MSKVSIAKAAKMFDVSRPTLLDHLKKGKISGEKVGEAWQIDMAELKRVYQRRGGNTDTTRHDAFAVPDMGRDKELESEIRLLQAKLEAAERLAEERAVHLEDLRALLPGPGTRRRWWPW